MIDSTSEMTEEKAGQLLAQDDVKAVIEAALNKFALREPTGDVRDGTKSTYPLTQLGNVSRICQSHGHTVRYLPESKGWIVWRDGRWVRDDDGAAVRSIAAGLPSRIYGEGADFGGRDGEAFAAWARKSSSLGVVSDTVALLSDKREVRVSLEVLDSSIWTCGLDGGRRVLDLETGQERPAAQDDYVTKSLGAKQVGSADKCQTWVKFLSDVMEGDSETMDWLQRFCGYLLTGSTQEQILLFCHGIGANGKSVFVNVLTRVLGDYARPLESEALVDHRRVAGTASPHLSALRGARMAVTSETSQGVPMAEGLVKSMTGGDVLQCRELYGSSFSFSPQFKLVVCGNHKPLISGTDNGIWRRMRLLPFCRVFAPHEQNPRLEWAIWQEADHILAWMLEGCLAWRDKGLSDVPRRVAEETGQYRKDMDTLGEWIDDCCLVLESVESETRSLYQSYENWARDSGLRAMSLQAFGRQLTERGFICKPTKTARRRKGLKVKEMQP